MKFNVKFESKLKGIKSLKKRNKVFNALTPEEQRREIAWDSLSLIESKTIVASQGCYWDSDLRSITGGDSLKFWRNESEIFQERLCNLTKKYCSVCARGAAMLSIIRLGNEVSPRSNYKTEGSYSTVKGFSMLSMKAMEDEYECEKYDHPYESNTTEKLANIMCNVIANGDFNTHDKTDYLSE